MNYGDNEKGSYTEFLIRSETEVERLLSELVSYGNPLTSFMEESGHMFVSRLRFIDPGRRFILADPGTNKAANSLLLHSDSVLLGGATGNAFVEFAGKQPRDIFIAGSLKIRFEFPESVLLRQRRTHRRIRVLPIIPLDCVVDGAGPFPFAAKIVDISPGGVGALISSNRTDLVRGKIFHGCRILAPNQTITGLDMEICHARKITLPSGKQATRAGFTFHGSQRDIESLVSLFIVNLEQPESSRD